MGGMQIRSILSLSLDKTWKGFGSPKQKLITAISLMLLGSALGWWIMGVEKAMKELKTISIWGLGPIAVLVSIVFLWNLLLAPFELLGDRIESVIKDSKRNETGSVVSQKTKELFERAIPSHWKHVQEFEAWKIAFLCAGFSPINANCDQNDAIRAKSDQIMGAINSGKLGVITSSKATQMGKKYWQVERKELQRYFKELGEVPEFLKE